MIKTEFHEEAKNMAYLWKILFFSMIMVTYGFGETIYIQQKQSLLKETPSFLGKTVVQCQYGDELKVITEKNEWKFVQYGSKKGWVHTTATTTKKIVMQGSVNAPSSVTSNEVMLAGKGFNVQVESEYRKKNPNLRFDLVDKMEKRTVTSQTQDAFIQIGQLRQ
jgi:hypothetical protein